MEKFALTIKELCYGLGIGRTKAFEMIRDHEFDSFKIGRRTLVTAESVQAFIEQKLFDDPHEEPGTCDDFDEEPEVRPRKRPVQLRIVRTEPDDAN